jgi:hypothetical protein
MPETLQSYFFRHRQKVAFGAVLFLAASLSFGLGYLADQEFNGRPIIIEKCSMIGADAGSFNGSTTPAAQ